MRDESFYRSNKLSDAKENLKMGHKLLQWKNHFDKYPKFYFSPKIGLVLPRPSGRPSIPKK